MLPLLLTLALSWQQVSAQALPDPAWPDQRPQLLDYQCPDRSDVDAAGNPAEDPSLTDAERARFAMRARYRDYFPLYLARVGPDPVTELVMPVDGVTLSQIADTYGAPRWDRSHEGVDIFAPRGTPVRASAPGFVYRIDDLSLGGLSVTIMGDGGARYFYTHFESVPVELLGGFLMSPAGENLVSKETVEFVKRVANAANARHSLDEGHALTIEWLAALANVSDRTIRSATSSSNPNAIPITKDGHWTFIEAPHASEWLSGRKDFVPTQRPDNRPTTTGLIRAAQPGDAWKEWREARGLTIGDLARKLGWTSGQAAAYQQIESGIPDDDMLTLLPAFWHALAAHLDSEDPGAVAALTYRKLATAYADWRVARTN